MLVLAFLLAAAAVYVGAFHVGPLHAADAGVLWLATRFDDTPVEFLSELIVLALNPLSYGLACAVLLAWGWRRRGLNEAITAGLLIVGANVTTQLLKQLTAEPRFSEILDRQVDPVSWPSGHATGAAAFAFAAWLLAPWTRRYGIAFAVAMGVAVVANNWHYPSDVLGGYCVVAAWGAAALTLRRPAATAAPRTRSRPATG